MNTQTTPQNALEEIKVSLKLKLSTLWASFMFLYIYVDYFALYMPSKIEDILTGIVFEFDITQGFLFRLHFHKYFRFCNSSVTCL